MDERMNVWESSNMHMLKQEKGDSDESRVVVKETKKRVEHG